MFEYASDDGCENSNCYPRMLPDEILNYKLRGAEVRFYNELKRQVPADWLVLYSCAWTSQWSNRTTNGEIDFIVVVPTIGILVIELKGGTVWYNGESQQWYQSISSGPKEINPFRLVKRGVHALRRKLSALETLADKRLEIFHAVAVPDVKINFETVGLEIDRNVMIDRTDINSLKERIEGILRHHVGNNFWSDGYQVRTAIEEEITQSVVLRAPLSLNMMLADDYMDHLTKEQNRGKKLESGIELTDKRQSKNSVHCTTIEKVKGQETPVAIVGVTRWSIGTSTLLGNARIYRYVSRKTSSYSAWNVGRHQPD